MQDVKHHCATVVLTEYRNTFSETGHDQSHSNISLAMYKFYGFTIVTSTKPISYLAIQSSDKS